MGVKIVFKEYIESLKDQEKLKSIRLRDPIPKLSEIATVIGMTDVGFSKMINNETGEYRKDVIDGIIRYMREKGFDMQITDFIQYTD